MVRFFTSLVLTGFLVSAIHAPAVMAKVLSVEEIRATLSASHRSEKNRARDRYRHPAETLVFFGLADDMTVVEVAPGRGWYTDVIAPLLLKRGKLYATGNALDVPGQRKYRYPRQRAYNKKIADNPQLYGAVEITAGAFMAETRNPARTSDVKSLTMNTILLNTLSPYAHCSPCLKRVASLFSA